MEARRNRFAGCSGTGRTRPGRVFGGFALVCLIAVAGCGGGERQDEDEPEGDFAVDVVAAMFPKQQKLAQSSNLVITVRNAGDEAVPNVAVTVRGLSYRATAQGLANSERPQFVVNGVVREIGGLPEAKDATPLGCDTAYVNTWACGRLKPGAEKTFLWKVTAVKAGPYEIAWRIAAGLDGRAKAVSEGDGQAPSGSFTGTVSDKAPDVRIADDGKTVVSGTR
ncbi:MAG: hypothetical protein H0T69_19090 [Thermoleophilaceae bacterium]|nr:hypothetical protein [Thermoleophilaceae bacterium]